MTRPVVPSIHGPDHAADGPDPIVFTAAAFTLTVFHSETAQAIPTGTLTRLTFSTAGAGAFFSATDGFATAGNEFGVHDIGQTTTQLMWTYRTGVMLVGCSVLWEAGNYAKVTHLQQGGADGGAGPTGSLESFFGSVASADGFTGGAYDAPVANMMVAQNPVETTWVTNHQHSNLWDIQGDGDGAAVFYVEVKQTSGSDKDVTGAKLSLLRLADTIGF